YGVKQYPTALVDPNGRAPPRLPLWIEASPGFFIALLQEPMQFALAEQAWWSLTERRQLLLGSKRLPWRDPRDPTLVQRHGAPSLLGGQQRLTGYPHAPAPVTRLETAVEYG